MRNAFLVSLAVLIVASTVRADFIGTVNKGNEAYRKNDFKTALDMYHSAETDRPESPELKYNIAGAQHQQGSFKEAIELYQGAIRTTDVALEAQAQYNLGSTYYRMKDYPNAIKAFEEALKRNPKDMDAKFNLELARKMLKEQLSAQPQDKQQNKQDQQQEQQQDQQQQQQQQNQQNQDQQNQQNQQDQQNQQNKDQQPQQQQQRAQMNQKKMSKEDAERILNALRDDEQDIQKKVRREQAEGDYVGKDW